ncbi:MAG TPA: OmpW family outer membrane protein [Wenzhouxiangella sp.]|nr:OmpW family outer membrane protein [Wenzhouxiangella sp.]
MTHFTRLIVAVAIAAMAASAQARKAGDWVLGGGVLHYAPQDKSQPLRMTSPVQQELAGSGASVRSATTLGLTAHYFVDDNWAVEGVIGVPPRINLDGSGTFAPLGRMGSARLWAPSILGKYFAGRPNDRFRVSLGAGLSYNRFRSVHLTSALQDTMSDEMGLPPGGSSTSASIGSKWAPVFNLGANYDLGNNWGISASVSWIPLKVRANLTTSADGQTIAASTTKIRLNPVVPFAYLTYRF